MQGYWLEGQKNSGLSGEPASSFPNPEGPLQEKLDLVFGLLASPSIFLGAGR